MSMMKEFKEFALKGNVVDLAVGLIIGTAFKSVVSSLVNDVLMPPIGQAMGGVDFGQLFVNIGDTAYATLAEAKAASAPVIMYGAFVQTIVDFVIIAFVVFMIVKLMNSMKKKEVEAAPAAPAEDIVLLTQIRDALKK